MSEEKTTTVRIYAGDLDQLKRHQLRISDRHGRWLTMPEIVRVIMKAAETKAESGE